jgi:hypothetical protein
VKRENVELNDKLQVQLNRLVGQVADLKAQRERVHKRSLSSRRRIAVLADQLELLLEH